MTLWACNLVLHGLLLTTWS